MTVLQCIRCGQGSGGGIVNPPRPTQSTGVADMPDPEEPQENGDLLETEDSLEEYVEEGNWQEEDIDESQLQESATQSSDESPDAGESESMTDESSLEDLIAGESPETEDEETQSLTPVEETTAEEAAVEEIPLESSEEEVPLEGSEEEVPSKSSMEEAAEESSAAIADEESAEATASEGNEAQLAAVTGRTLVSTKTESHDYIYAGGKLLRDTITITADGTATTQTLDFRYDENGYPYSMIRTSGGTTTIYYYITNLQGDVMYLVDESGSTVASYIYDPYGNILTATGELAEVNPLRYRGYVYDEETGFYYVSSRYYDPEIERFINADAAELIGANGDFTSLNLFAYCGNNPVIREDKGGHFWNLAAGAILGGIINGFSQVITNVVTGNEWSSGVLGAVVTGAASGALAASSAARVYQTIGNAVISGVSEVVNQYNNYMENPQDFSMGNAVLSVTSSAISGAVAGYVGGDGVRASKSDYKYALDKLVQRFLIS